jgi:hypothetical protein
MTLRESIASDAASVFLSTDEFAEAVVYRPRDGGARSIVAIVDREPPTLMDEAGNVVSLTFLIHVANSKTLGITAEEVDTGGDEIEVIEKAGGVTRRRVAVIRVMENDNGMVQLAVR